MDNKVFDSLFSLNVNDHIEKKTSGSTTLSYLSWSYAWAEVMKRYPDATYTIWKNENNLPYAYDPLTGYMVYTTVTIEGITREMWLPVMDSSNKAMKSEPYTIKTKYKDIVVQAATMFDINKTVMRCLTKNLAMFGLGLYIYTGEDLPESESPAERSDESMNREITDKANASKIDKNKISVLKKKLAEIHVSEEAILNNAKISSFDEMTLEMWMSVMKWAEKKNA